MTERLSRSNRRGVATVAEDIFTSLLESTTSNSCGIATVAAIFLPLKKS